MERRVFIAILLSFVVLYGYQALFPPPEPPRPQQATPAQAKPVPATPTPSPEQVVERPVTPAPAAVKGETSEREITIETATVRAVMSNRGARILHWWLKDYRDPAGDLVDLVPSAIPADEPRPFALQVDDRDVTTRLNEGIYHVTGDTNGRVDATQREGVLVFEFEDVRGLRVRKEFRFDPRPYLLTFSADVAEGERTFNPSIAWGPGLGDIGAISAGGSWFTGNYVQPPQAIYHAKGERDPARVTASAVAQQSVHEGQYNFAGIDDHYFIATTVNPGKARLEYRALTLPGPDNTQRQLLAQTIKVSGTPRDVQFFVGPKQFNVLQSVNGELVRAINFGWFGFLATPLLNALKWINGFVGNYGWSIILLTIIINLLIFPLRHKSVVSMRKMQVLQPQLKAIQDRYADLKVTDPARQKMNTEIMNLYREKGVNPASGCVPMLLTLPVLFAFYSVLSQAIELRGASFGLWIKDLSTPDPYYVTPILMGISMFWQQKITPTTADPAQQKIMMIMPLMFSFMFLRAPSGLVIYWFVSQLWAIGQQYFTNWLIGPPTVATVRPPAERRLKSAGTGRTAGAERKN